MIVTAGSVDRSVFFYIVEDQGGTNPGEPKTGLLYTDLTSASYARQGAVRVAITPATLASASAAHADGGFIEVDATNMPGVYRFDPPDAAFATGVDQVVIAVLVAGASNAVARPLNIDITDFDLRTANVTLKSGTHTGAVIPTVTDLTNLPAITTGWLTATGIAAGALDGKGDWALASNWTAARAGYVDNINGHTPQTGDSFARLGAPSGLSVSADILAINNFVDTEVAAILADTGEIGTAGAGLTNLGGMSTGMKAEINAEVLDVMNTDTYGEPGQGTPPATASIFTKLNYLYKAWRNEWRVTATQASLYNDAGTVVDQKHAHSDDGTTYTKNEVATGP